MPEVTYLGKRKDFNEMLKSYFDRRIEYDLRPKRTEYPLQVPKEPDKFFLYFGEKGAKERRENLWRIEKNVRETTLDFQNALYSVIAGNKVENIDDTRIRSVLTTWETDGTLDKLKGRLGGVSVAMIERMVNRRFSVLSAQQRLLRQFDVLSIICVIVGLALLLFGLLGSTFFYIIGGSGLILMVLSRFLTGR